MKKAVITGIGMAASFAGSPDELYEVLQGGENAAGFALTPKLKGVRGLAFADSLTKKLYAAFARAAADSGIDLINIDAERTGIFLGDSFGSLKSIVGFETKALRNGCSAATPMDFINTVMNAPAGQLAILYGLSGINTTISTGSCASIDALSFCADMIKEKRIRLAFAGGAEENERPYSEYIRANGAEPSDGACIFTVEEKADAIKRGARIYAELAGGASGYNSDYEEKDILAVTEAAAKNAGISLKDISFAVTSLGARGGETEYRAIKTLGVQSVDIKPVIGETYSASGAFAVSAALAVMERGMLPNGASLKDTEYALINSFGFDGHMGCAVLKKYVKEN